MKLALDRLADSRVLLAAGRYDAAYYIAGYTVECALKACIARRTQELDFPPPPNVVREIYTHDFGKLLKAANLYQLFDADLKADPQLEVHWRRVKDWSEETRYDITKIEEEARHLIEAIGDVDHGVLACIRKYW